MYKVLFLVLLVIGLLSCQNKPIELECDYETIRNTYVNENISVIVNNENDIEEERVDIVYKDIINIVEPYKEKFDRINEITQKLIDFLRLPYIVKIELKDALINKERDGLINELTEIISIKLIKYPCLSKVYEKIVYKNFSDICFQSDGPVCKRAIEDAYKKVCKGFDL